MLRDRRLIEHAGRNLDVLALQRVGDVVGGQAERLHAIGIEPHPHGVVACAEHGDRADAVDARDRVGHFERGVVGDEQRVTRLVRRVEVHDHHQVGRRLLHGDADIAHVGGQARVGDGDAVLHLHLGDVQIGAELKADRDRKATVGGRVRRDIDHILDAVDLLFDRRDHRRGHDLGTGAGILPGDADQGRRDLGILRDRQAQERHRAQDREDDRNHRGKDRPIDEEVRDAHLRPAHIDRCIIALIPAKARIQQLGPRFRGDERMMGPCSVHASLRLGLCAVFSWLPSATTTLTARPVPAP